MDIPHPLTCYLAELFSRSNSSCLTSTKASGLPALHPDAVTLGLAIFSWTSAIFFNQLGAVSTVDHLIALRIQNLAYFPQENPMLCARLMKSGRAAFALCIAIVVGPPLR